MPHHHVTFVLVATLATAFPALAGAQVAMSCDDEAALSSCDRHEPAVFAILGVESIQGLCDLSGGRWSAEPCPTKGVVGVCGDGNGSTFTYYSTGGDPYDAGRALATCQQIEGTFTAAGEIPKQKTCSDHAALSVCSEHTPEAVALVTEPVMEQICGLTSGVWSGKPCPPGSRIGACDDGSGSTTLFYSDGGSPFDLATAQQSCLEIGGAFSSAMAPPPLQPTATSPRSCNDISLLGTCSDLQPSAFMGLGEAVFQEMCSLSNGIWSATPCPTARRVGSCDDGTGGRVHFYSIGGVSYDETIAKATCAEGMMIWVPVP